MSNDPDYEATQRARGAVRRERIRAAVTSSRPTDRLGQLEHLLVLARDFRDQMVEQGHARRSLPAEYDTLSDAIDALEPPPCAST